MPMMCPNYLIGQRIRLNDPADPWHHGQVGTVRSVKGPLVPIGLRENLPVPPGWTWYTYTVELDGNDTLRGVSENKLEKI